MKKNSVVIVILGFTLIIGGLLGTYMTRDTRDSFASRMTSSDMMNINSNNTMMKTTSKLIIDKDAKVIALNDLQANVETYLDSYEENLVVSDIFIFEDSEYYFSIIEEDTGRGAMELLVNQYTGDIYPEFGPNMMWNLKYGMHDSNMMSGKGMMSGRNMTTYNIDNYSELNNINSEEAFKYGEQYLTKTSESFNIAEEFHEFYGYYTFHVEESDNVVGMLSVNGLTGEVWYREWHGVLTEVISVHDDH